MYKETHTHTHIHTHTHTHTHTQESRDQLQRRLDEIAPATASDPSISAAEREARILLNEVDMMFFK